MAISLPARRAFSRPASARLVRCGFTVDATTSVITGSTDGLLKKLIIGGRFGLQRLKRLGLRA